MDGHYLKSIMGIAERKIKEKQTRINQITGSAGFVFSQKGYEKATMDEIAKRAQISKATIYLYFKTKEDLFYELFREKLNELSKNLIKIRKKNEDPEEMVRSIVRYSFEFYSKYPDIYQLISRFKAAEANKVLSADKVTHLEEIMSLNLKQVAMAIEKGIKKGIFKEMDPTVGAVIFWNMFLGVLQYQENRLELGKNDYRKSTLEASVDCLLLGMIKR